MNRSLLAATLVLALSGGIAFAQAPDDAQQPPPQHFRHHQPDPQREAQHLGRQFNLTADQTTKLATIFTTRDQQMEAIRTNGQLTQQDAHQQMRSVMQATQQQLATVLTPDEMQQMHHGHHGMHGHWHPGQDGQAGQGGPDNQQPPPPPPPSGL